MKTLFTLILSSSFLLTGCGQDSKSKSAGSAAPVTPVESTDKTILEKGKVDANLPTLQKVTDGDPSGFERTPKQFSDKEKSSADGKKATIDSKPAPAPKVKVEARPEVKGEVKAEAKPVAKTEKKSKPVVEAPKASPYKGEGEQEAPPQAQTPPKEQAPPQQITPCYGPCKEKISQPEFSGLEVTGMVATPDQSYISLVNDGIMTSIRREMTRGSGDQITANARLARTLTNGRMFVDASNGDRLVTVKVLENNQTQTYNFRVVGYTNRLKPMQLVSHGAHSKTTGRQNLKASLACLDTCGKCEIAVLKIQNPGQAKAYAILRTATTDLKFRLQEPNTNNSDVLDIRRFFVNADLRNSSSDQLDTAKVETFEVAYGVSMVRTIIKGMNGEIFSQVSPLVHSTKGALSVKMRMTDRNPQDLDMSDLHHRSTRMSGKVALASLVQVDGLGGMTVSYKTQSYSSSVDGDRFQVKFKARGNAAFPMTGALLH